MCEQYINRSAERDGTSVLCLGTSNKSQKVMLAAASYTQLDQNSLNYRTMKWDQSVDTGVRLFRSFPIHFSDFMDQNSKFCLMKRVSRCDNIVSAAALHLAYVVIQQEA